MRPSIAAEPPPADQAKSSARNAAGPAFPPPLAGTLAQPASRPAAAAAATNGRIKRDAYMALSGKARFEPRIRRPRATEGQGCGSTGGGPQAAQARREDRAGSPQ